MPKINVNNCKTKGKTEEYTFIPLIFSESFFAGNQLVFKNLKVIQIGIDKTDLCLDDCLII